MTVWRLLLLLFCLARTLGAQEAAPLKIGVQVLGKVPDDVIQATTAKLQKLYVAEVEILPVKALPKVAYYEPRGRYRADKLLDWLVTETDPKYAKVIGITTVDVSTSKGEIYDWGVFGLGQLGGRSCVVSTFRLGKKVSRAKLLDRVAKVAGHEVGHTLGLEHCPTPHCLMSDAEGKVATVDGEGGELCEQCKARVPAK